MALHYICYIRNGRLQIEDAEAAGGPKSNATLFASASTYPHKVRFEHGGKHPFSQQNREALAVAAHNAWTNANHSATLYEVGGIDVLHGRARNVSYSRLQTLIANAEEPAPTTVKPG